jgi:hypothetical protein
MVNKYDGSQIDYEAYMDYKGRQKDPDPYSVTSSDIYLKKKNEQESEIMSSLIMGAGYAASAAAAAHYVNNNQTALELLNKLPGNDNLDKRLRFNRAANNTFEGIEPNFNGSLRPVSNILQSTLLNLEELSPLHILKTLQLSSAASLFTANVNLAEDVHISGDVVNNYNDYVQKLLKAQGNRELTSNDARNGFILRDGKLYGVTSNGLIDLNDIALNKARIVHTTLDIGGNRSPNRIFEKYSNIYGAAFDREAADKANLMFVGARDTASLLTDWTRAYGRYAMEIGYKTLDNPVAGFEEILNMTGLGDSKFVNNKYYQAIKNKLNISLGTGGAYDLSTRESLKITAKNIAVKSAALYVGYNILNSGLSAITGEENPYHQGLISGLAASYANMSVGFAKLWSDNFQDYKNSQEAAAEGSTSLLALAGLPLAGAMLGANTAFAQRMYHTKKHGMLSAATHFGTERTFKSDKIFSMLGLAKEEKILNRYAKIGALAGGLLALPFLPGALVGKSSDELKAEYSGEKEVAVKANRYWLAGGTAYEGENVKYFKKHIIAETIANARNKTYYESMSQKRAMDPIFSPLAYLKNPYAREEATKESMPYPVWGMNVTYGSFFGEAFQGTLGQIIKPTVINPEFLKNYVISKKDIFSLENSLIKKTLSTSESDNDNQVSDGSIANAAAEQDKLKRGARSIFSKLDEDYVTQTSEKSPDKSMIKTGDMLRKESAEIDQTKIASSAAYVAAADFTGLKGFTSSMILGSAGIDPTDYKKQLAMSGDANSAQSQIQDLNLGDMAGLGEFQRRIVPTSAASKKEYINPMKNNMPSWLPSDESKYYLDFSIGNPYDKIENGAVRLPGRGFAALNPTVKNLDPEKYPLVYQYKILADVAAGSPEQIAMRNYLLSNKDQLSETEQKIFFTSLEQTEARKEKRKFHEYTSKFERANFSAFQDVQSSLWNTITHNSESVLEPLTPFRPAAKFLHKRTAIEDYVKTQLQGSDVGIWTNPYSHFIEPAINRTYGLLPGVQKPAEASEKEAVDEYFDKLSLLRAIKIGNINSAKKTVIASNYAGIRDKESMDKLRAALPENQRLYLESFAKEKDVDKRKQIIAMLPTDIRQAYASIWANIDIADAAKAAGRDPLKAIEDNYYKDTETLKKTLGITLDKNTKDRIKKSTETITDRGEKASAVKEKEAEAIRLEAARREAQAYVDKQTGTPSQNWKGWDPRLTTADIKLRTLSIGREDIHKYGYWKSDLERNERLVGLDSEREVIRDFDRIKQELKSQQQRKARITTELNKNGFNTSKIDIVPAAQNTVRIQDRRTN